MLYKSLALVLLLGSCSTIDLTSVLYQAEITTTLKTPHHKEEFSTIDWELKKLFKAENSIRKCNIEIGITKTTLDSGISSTLFAVNKNILLKVAYTIKCSDGLKTANTVTQSTDLTLQQEQTVAQYVGERKVSRELCLQIAKSIHDEVKLFFATNVEI
jgi:hypothetical protein